MPRLTALALLFLVTACQPDGTTSSNPGPGAGTQTSPRPAVRTPAVDASDGVDPAGANVILFGDRLVVEDSAHASPLYLDRSTRALVTRGMAPFGTPRASKAPADCPAGTLDFLDYPNGLQLAFQDDVFVGYWVHEGAWSVATEHGVHPGSPRSALGDAGITEASFGFLVDLDGVVAILDERKHEVTDLYAGAACIYD